MNEFDRDTGDFSEKFRQLVEQHSPAAAERAAADHIAQENAELRNRLALLHFLAATGVPFVLTLAAIVVSVLSVSAPSTGLAIGFVVVAVVWAVAVSLI